MARHRKVTFSPSCAVWGSADRVTTGGSVRVRRVSQCVLLLPPPVVSRPTPVFPGPAALTLQDQCNSCVLPCGQGLAPGSADQGGSIIITGRGQE